MTRKSFVPEDFEVPAVLETDQFRLRMLSVDDVEKDYEAVMESRERLSAISGMSCGHTRSHSPHSMQRPAR